MGSAAKVQNTQVNNDRQGRFSIVPNSSSRLSRRTAIFSGIVNGQVAGLFMAIAVMAVFTLFLGHDPLYPVQLIGSALFGESALQGFHFGAFLTGLLIHQLGPSLIWGGAFGFLASRFNLRDARRCAIFGLGIGVVSMIDVYLLVPAFFNSMHGIDLWNREVPMAWSWAAHLIFGLCFAFYPRCLKWVSTNWK